MNSNKNPKGSNVYKDDRRIEHTTPIGSHLISVDASYKHTIPLGLGKGIMEIKRVAI